MPVKKEHAKQLSDSIYSRGIFSGWKLILAATILTIVGFLITFNLRGVIKDTIALQLSRIKSCPITYQGMNVTFLPPAVHLVSPTIHGRCFDRRAESLQLAVAKIRVAAPSLYPLGIKLHTHLGDKYSSINIHSSISFSKQWIKIQNTTLGLDSLRFMSHQLPSIKGGVSIDALVSLAGNKLSSAQVYMKSNDIHLPGQNQGGIDLPDMKIGNFSFKGQYDQSGSLKITDLIVGNPLSPIVAQLTGEVEINQARPPLSRLNLNGEVKFSSQLLQSFSILNLFLGGKREKNGFYQLAIKGTLQNPLPSIL